MRREWKVTKGNRFGRLIVNSSPFFIRKSSCRRSCVRCICRCGRQVIVQCISLHRRHSSSCGKCIHATHGESHSRLYRIWTGMNYRCRDTKNRNYGARGIRVRWRTFHDFRRWARKNGYQSTLTIDRRNSNGDYCPTNCRWVGRQVQAINRRKSRGASRYKGVTWNRLKGKWQAQIGWKGKCLFLGLFTNEKTAAVAYNMKALELCGEFACLNFPRRGKPCG